MSELILNENATATVTPSAGERSLYPKADGWYDLDDNNVETKVGGATALPDLGDVVISSPEKGDVLVYDLNDDSKWASGKLNGFVFGCGFSEASRSDFQSTSSVTYVNYLTETNIPCVANKKSRIGVFAIINGESTSRDIYVEVTIKEGSGSETQIGEMRLEPKEGGTDNQIPVSGFFYYTPTTTDTVTIKMNFKSEQSGYSVYMFHGAIEWWRVEL